jgi:hypothetical protein
MDTKIIKNLFLFLLVIAFINGCGGGGSSTSDNTTTTTQGIAVDDYIVGATFFWDKDKDGIHDSDEPLSSASDSTGKFTFSVKVPAGERIVMKDAGEHLGVPYEGKLSANLGSAGVVSPLTTLEVQYPNSDIVSMLQSAGVTLDAADIHKDPMDAANKKVDLTAATVAVDAFLKLDSDNNVIKTADTLKDLLDSTKAVLGTDLDNTNIQNLIKFNNRLVQKIKTDKSLSELTKVKTDSTYRANLKTTLSGLSALEVSVVNDLSSDGTSVTYKFDVFDGKFFSFIDVPTKDVEANLSINMGDTSGIDVNWSVIEKPASATITLVESSDQKSVKFTPSEAGKYTIQVIATSGNAQATRKTTFFVANALTFDENDVQSISSDNTKKIGPVSNQSWVSSKTLDETALTTLVSLSKYDQLTKVGYDTTNGLLITYTPSASVKEQIALLKLESGVDKVFNRVFASDNAYDGYTITPDDNGKFDDGGSNWHLEVINMPEAWEYSQGSEEFLLGVSDGGYDTLHDDLQDRFASILTSAKHSHGMGVTGSMAAKKDNQKGISGINDTTQVVASYMGGQYVEQVITTEKDNKEVKLINNSWGYHLASDFNPTNNSVAQQRFEDMQNIYAQVRQLITYYDNKLFFWAAGNGVGNGYSTSGYYGVDAKYENGSLHYKDNLLNRLDNLLVVGAFNENKNLVYYSAYGESVDIASPTKYDSLSLNNGIYQNFSGTSAAAPVATAVASLIYSINPKLSAKEVKNILITSATEYVTQRQKDPSGTLEYLAKPIPIINAKEALKKAAQTVQGNVTVQSKLTNILNPTLQLTYSSADVKYEIVSVEASVKSSTSQANYTSFGTQNASSDTIEVSLDPNKKYHSIDATVTLKYIATGDIFTQTHTYLYDYSDITIHTIDNISLQPIGNVNIAINKLDSDMNTTNAISDNNGILKIYVDGGEYRLKGVVANYKDATKDIHVQQSYSIQTDLPLTKDDANIKQGSISGVVTDEQGIAIPNAIVKISGGVFTNGFFASATTDENGYYKLTNISKNASDDFNNTLIESFTMEASKVGYIKLQRDGVIILEGLERTENFNLIQEVEIPDSEFIYKNDFEDDVNDWNMTGMWHKQNLSDHNITNVNIAKGNVALAPDENGTADAGKLPLAFKGASALWYGQSTTGNFIGTEAGTYVGGTSTLPNSGTLTSPAITIGDINATLRFNTWWEIESVNPNVTGYDLLELYIVEEGKDYSNKCSDWTDGTSWYNDKIDEILGEFGATGWDTIMKQNLMNMQFQMHCYKYNAFNTETGDLIKKLNPAIDPVVHPREKLAFSSGGFNRKPIWTQENIDLSKYAGKTIRIKFKFNTKDALYNGFRGWLIDNLEVIDNAKLNN